MKVLNLLLKIFYRKPKQFSTISLSKIFYFLVNFSNRNAKLENSFPIFNNYLKNNVFHVSILCYFNMDMYFLSVFIFNFSIKFRKLILLNLTEFSFFSSAKLKNMFRYVFLTRKLKNFLAIYFAIHSSNTYHTQNIKNVSKLISYGP